MTCKSYDSMLSVQSVKVGGFPHSSYVQVLRMSLIATLISAYSWLDPYFYLKVTREGSGLASISEIVRNMSEDGSRYD